MDAQLNINIEKTVQYWLEGADYDIGVADAMLGAGKYPYALFMGHLAIEKLLKAIVVKQTKAHAPHTHSLPLLASKTSLEIPDETKKKLAGFMEFHLEARYPEERKEFYQKCTEEFSRNSLNEIKKVFTWLKDQL
jgi:HEPN domain-containing protein